MTISSGLVGIFRLSRTLRLLAAGAAMTAGVEGRAQSTAFAVTEGDWSSSGSWGAGVPSLSLGASFSAFGGARTALLTDSPLTSQLTIGGGTPVTLTNASAFAQTLTIQGNNGEGGVRSSVVSSALTISDLKVVVQGGPGAVGTFTFANTATSLALNAGAELELAGPVVFSSGGAKVIEAAFGTGTLDILSTGSFELSGGNNTVSVGSGITLTSAGTMFINQGTLSVGSSASDGSSIGGTLNYNFGLSSTFRNTGTLTFAGLSVTTIGGGTDLIENQGALAITGDLSVGAITGFNQSGGGSSLTFGGGALILNTPMAISGGTVRGSIATGPTGTGDLTVSGGAVLSPGAADGDVGTLRFPDQLNLTAGALTVDIDGDALGDLATAGGAVSLGGTALLTVNSVNVSEGSEFVILSGASLSGTFAGLADGATITTALQNYTIAYSGTDVRLLAVPVPEPAQVAGATAVVLLGGAMVMRRGGRRRTC